MISAEEVEAVILDALRDLNDELPPDRQIEISRSTELFGVDAELDSLSLVSVIADVTSMLRRRLGLDVALVDDRAMSRDVLPFTNVQTLTEYILELAAEQHEEG